MEQLDLKYLQYALAVLHYGSVTHAAQKLYLAQPNLSRAIGDFEQSLGFPLFVRSRQGMRPTPEGEQFLSRAEEMMEELIELAQKCRQEKKCSVHFACVPSSVFVNSLLEVARRTPEMSIRCEEYYDCIELFDRIGKGQSQAAFLTFGSEMKKDLMDFWTRKNLEYHTLGQSPAYGVVRRTSPLYHPEETPPFISYDNARLMLNADYFESIGVHFQMENAMLPHTKEICHGVGRAGNLDMLESMNDLVMLSCHNHSKIMLRNDLVAVPIQPSIMAYEYGYVIKRGTFLSNEVNMLLNSVEQAVQQELNCE